MATDDLAAKKQAWQNALAAFEGMVAAHFPGASKWHWYRAVAAERGENCARNDDTSRDAAMAADCAIAAAHDEYIRLLHVFYRARDGINGVLGAHAPC